MLSSFTRGPSAAFLAVFVLFLLVPGASRAQVPQTISYQGSLTDSSGAPVSGAVTMTFSLYDAAVGGTLLWQETQPAVSVTNGAFSAVFGADAGNPLDVSLFAGQLYLGIAVGADAEMTPRQALTAVGYAIQAKNAETLGGLLSSEIVAAAQDEVRIPISALPFVISAPGSYYLTGNLSLADTAADGITVNADDVTIDLMGYSLIGPGSGTGSGIYAADRSNVEVRNGTLRAFGRHGIELTRTVVPGPGGSNRAIAVRASANGISGIVVLVSGGLVSDCTAVDNGSQGIAAFGTVVHNSVFRNAGIGIDAGPGSTLIGNTAKENGNRGIRADVGSTVTGNTAEGNGHTGIDAGNGSSTVTDNTASSNANIGILAGDGSTVTGNTVSDNGSYGIWTDNGARVTDNTVMGNNTIGAAAAGIRVFQGNLVEGNVAFGNSVNNILVGGQDNAVEENLATGSTNGINFVGTGNFYANNRASGNTVNYVNGVGQTDGGGNVSF